MIQLLTFILVCYGATLVITQGKIFDNIRPKGHYWRCSMCVGFAVGIIAAYIDINTGLFAFDNNIVTLIMLGALSSGTSYILCTLFDDTGFKLNLGLSKDEETD